MSSLSEYKRTTLCAKLCAFLVVIIVSSAVASDFDASLTRGTSRFRENARPHPRQSTYKRYGRNPAAAKDDDDDELDDLKDDPLLAGVDLDGDDQDKEDKEDADLLKKTKHILDGKNVEDGGHEKPLSFKDLGRITKDIGLSDEDLADLEAVESGKITLKKADSNENRDPDERPLDMPPPPGMLGNPREMRKVADFDPHQPKIDKPLLPRDPSHVRANSTKRKPYADDTTAKSAEDDISYEARVFDLNRKLDTARQQITDAKRETVDAKRQISTYRVQYARAKRAFQRSLESAREEDKTEMEEMKDTIRDQKRAFDELFEEKQLLSRMLSDEQRTLKELQEKIQHPDLGLWVRQRAEKAAILVENPETDAMKYYAKKYMAPKVTKMRHRLELLEKRVERTVDHLLPAKYGSIVALLLSIGLVGFPIVVTMSTVVSVTKSVSLRQYVLLGNVFLTAFAAGLCIAGILLRQDPLQTLYEASETLFITLQLTTAVAFPVFLGVIGLTVLRSRDRLDAFVFGCEFVFYSLVAMNYRSRVWRPAMLGQNIETSAMMYAIYLMDFLSMSALTISSARIEETGMVRDADPELGVENKVAGIAGSGLLPSVSSKVSSLSSGLIHAAMGHGRTGKDE